MHGRTCFLLQPHRSASSGNLPWVRVPESWPRIRSQLCAPFFGDALLAQKLLLIADDEENNRLVFSAILTHSQYNVLLAQNGHEAVEQARLHAPDLILMDSQMPVMDGWEATRLLRADPETASIPIVAVTAQEYTAQQLQEGGFCAYIRKPVVPRDLVRALELCLEGTNQKKPWIDLRSVASSLRQAL